MRMRLQIYDLKHIAKKGTDIPVADALSRNFVKLKTTDENFKMMFNISAEKAISTKHFTKQRLIDVKNETEKDETLQKLKETIINGWPEHRQFLHPSIKPYWDIREDIAILDGILFRGQRVLIPEKMQREILKIIHSSHQGMVKCKQLAKDVVYWPGINNQIEDMVSKCSICQRHRRKQIKEPLKLMPVPELPWQQLGTDLFDCIGKKKWLIVPDYYSEFFEIAELSNKTAPTIIESTKKIMATHGIADIVICDNGPPFNSKEYAQFSKDYGFKINFMSPTHSQTNGMVEKCVGIAKNILKKTKESGDDPYLALLNHRNTPRDDVTGSPAQRLYSRRTCTQLPTAKSLLKPESLDSRAVQSKLIQHRLLAKSYYDRSAKPLPNLNHGDTVHVRHNKEWEECELVPDNEQTNYPRSYNVKLPSGRIWRRNRRDLLKTSEPLFQQEDLEDEEFVTAAAAQPSCPQTIVQPNSGTSSISQVPPVIMPAAPSVRPVPKPLRPNL